MANHKSRLKAYWERSFQDFDELSSSTPSTESQIFRRVNEEYPCIEDDEAICIPRSALQGVTNPADGNEVLGSQAIDAFIERLFDTDPSSSDKSFCKAHSPGNCHSHITESSSPSSTHSIDKFIRTLLPTQTQSSQTSFEHNLQHKHLSQPPTYNSQTPVDLIQPCDGSSRLTKDPHQLNQSLESASQSCEAATSRTHIKHGSSKIDGPSSRQNELVSRTSSSFSPLHPEEPSCSHSITEIETVVHPTTISTRDLVDESSFTVSSIKSTSFPSQAIESTQSTCQNEFQIEPDDFISQPITCSNTQPIHEAMNELVDEDFQSTFSSRADDSEAQMPDILSKLSGVTTDEVVDVESGGARSRQKMTGMAEKLCTIIKREQSDYAITRHHLAQLGDERLTTSMESSVQLRYLGLEVTSATINRDNLIECLVLSCPTNSPSCGSKVKLAIKSLRLEGQHVKQGDELTVYWPWRVFPSAALGPVIFSSSYCEITRSSLQAESPAGKPMVLAHNTCVCTSDKKRNIYPVYKGPYALLRQ
ncbi:uncharacterized protein [Watersipora subatra]|uniref:uncharacterized protein n=1 Tax=Watersipora subatra TaxID=2589382 RepID=UPI00355B2179